jgi:aspartokinase-like uncharacterized kinase
MMPSRLIVAKVGGSLYDLPDLSERLRNWLAAQGDAPVLLAPGGGPTADVVRELDRVHGLGEERAHWLALRSLTFNAHFLLELVPGACLVSHPEAWPQGCRVGVLDGYTFARRDEGRPGSLPHTWDVTSDSVAARAAVVADAAELVLLKSTDIQEGCGWASLEARGLIDTHFGVVVRDADLCVRFVNLRGTN